MGKKIEAVNLIKKKLSGESYLSYKEIAELTGYHPKYLLRLKKEVINGTVSLVHGNTHKDPPNKMKKEEKEYIISLYKRSNASIKKFCKFYGRRSYSCVYNVLKEAGFVDEKKES